MTQSALDPRNSPDYQMGYRDGYREGHLKAVEELRDLFEQASNAIPRQVIVDKGQAVFIKDKE